MSRALEPLDLGVVIDRVLVRVGDSGPPEAAELPLPAASHSRDHRIVVGELCIEIEAAMDTLEARDVGDRVARALGDRLEALQARRADSILAGRDRGALVLIGALRVKLRGLEAERPQPHAIAARLADAIERRIAS